MIKVYLFMAVFYFVRLYYTSIRKKPVKTLVFFVRFAPDDVRRQFMKKLFFKNNEIYEIFNKFVEEAK